MPSHDVSALEEVQVKQKTFWNAGFCSSLRRWEPRRSRTSGRKWFPHQTIGLVVGNPTVSKLQLGFK